MDIFLDTAKIEEIRPFMALGLVDGVTTNPSLIAKSGRPILEAIREIAELVPGPISAEVVSTDHESMMKEADILLKLGKNIVIKVPLTEDGLKSCYALACRDVKVNVTLCFSVTQALAAAKAGATYVSPFVGRIDDVGLDGIAVLADICEAYQSYAGSIKTQVLAASIRNVQQLTDCIRRAAPHVVTLPPAVISAMVKHPLTNVGLDAFLKDWKATGQSIA